MAEYLTFLRSKSAAFIFRSNGVISFADENFAREILQVSLAKHTFENICASDYLLIFYALKYLLRTSALHHWHCDVKHGRNAHFGSKFR